MRRCHKLISMIVMMAMLATMTPYQALAAEPPSDAAAQENQTVAEEEGQEQEQDTQETITEDKKESDEGQEDLEEGGEAAPSEDPSEVTSGSDAVDNSSTEAVAEDADPENSDAGKSAQSTQETAAPEEPGAEASAEAPAETTAAQESTEETAAEQPMSFQGRSDSGVRVTAKAPAGAFGTPVTMTVCDARVDAATEAQILDTADGSRVLAAVDITFWDGEGNQVEPQRQITVTISSAALNEAEHLQVVHVDTLESGAVDRSSAPEQISSSSTGGDTVVLVTDEFSIYAVVGTEALNRVEVSFKVGDSVITGATQIVKAGDRLNKPDPDPVDPNGTAAFAGWQFSDGTAVADAYFGDALTDERIAALVQKSGQTPSDDNHHLVELTLTPAFAVQYTVTFMEKETASDPDPVADTYTVASGGSVSLAGVNYTAPEGKALTGWTDGTTTYTGTITNITGNMTLRPVLASGYMLHFETKGGTLIAPQFVPSGSAPTRPANDPAKQGYIFDDWYVSDEDGAAKFDFSAALSADAIAYAKWTPGVSEFNILYYVQDPNSPDTYTFYTSRARTGTTDSLLSDMMGTSGAEVLDATERAFIADAFRQQTSAGLCETHFVKESALPAALAAAGTIKADGSTTLRVEIDCWYVQLKFRLANGTYSQAYTYRYGQGLPDLCRLVYPDSQYSAYWDPPTGYYELEMHYPNFNSPTYGWPKPFPPQHEDLCLKDLHTNAGASTTNPVQIPKGGVIYMTPLFNSAANLYFMISYRETLESTPEARVYKLVTEWFKNQNPDAGFAMNADEKWIADHWEYVEKADAINYHYTAVAPSKYPEEDTEQTGTYRWGRIWYFRQRYDLTWVCLPDDSANQVDEDIMWDTPLAGYVPTGYEQNKTAMIDDVKHRFVGWYRDATRAYDLIDPTADDAVMPTKDLTLYAKWVPVTYDVVIHFNDGVTPDLELEDQVYGTVLPTPTIPDNGDKTLTGWYTTPGFDEGTEFFFGAGGTQITDYIVDSTGTVHVYAKWVDPNVYYTVEYHGANPPTDSNSYLDGGTIALLPGNDNGSQRFIGWTLTAPSRSTTDTRPLLNGTVDAVAANADAERVIHLYPVYATESQPTALLVYHANYPDGSDPTHDSSETAVNGELTVLALAACGFTAPGGWTFDGWTTNADGSGTKYAAGDPLAVEASGNVLYAQWKHTATGKYSPEVRKALNGRPLEKDQFTFTLTDKDGNELQAKNDAAGRVYFDDIEYDQDDMNKDENGNLIDTDVVYTAKEVFEKKDGYTYSKEEYTITVTLHDNMDGTITATADKKPEDCVFHNTYEATGKIELPALKKLLGERALEEGQFTFKLKNEAGDVLSTKTNGADGSVLFDAIEYTQDDIYTVDEYGVYSGANTKTYNYTISEEIPEGAVDNGDGTFFLNGYTYDGTVYNVAVVLTDNGDGTITAVVAGTEDGAEAGDTETGDTEYVFANAYDANGTLKLDARKVFDHGVIKGGEFTFELKDAEGEVLQTKTNDAKGNVSFEMLTYDMKDLAGAPYVYTVSEVTGKDANIEYDKTVYTVTVDLADNGDGTLKVTKKIDNGGELVFTNKQLNVQTSIKLGGIKVLKGKDLKKGQFTFVLSDESGKNVMKAKNDADGNFTFDEITYKLEDLKGEKKKVYIYGISEINDKQSGIVYDDKAYTVKVTVTDIGDGTMTAVADTAIEEVKFTNSVSTKSNKTGDETRLLTWSVTCLLAGTGLMMSILRLRRKRKHKS